MKLKPIADQVVVVFGASSGIGRETARQFARRGARVVVAARSQPGLDSLVEEIRRDGGQATAVVADAADYAQVQAVADRAVAEYGRLDTWVHAAATSIYGYFDQITPEEFRRVIEVNLLGQAYGAMAALPYLRREGRGALIHVSSVEARRAMPLHSPYTASKHGIQGFVEALRMELEHESIPISLTQVLPASINTPLFNKSRTKMGVMPKGVPPIYQPRMVADAILHAAEHPTREIIAGGAGRLILLGNRLAPRLTARLVAPTAFTGQRTDIPKSVDDPNNLFAPTPMYDRVEGDFGHMAMKSSLYTRLRMRPMARALSALAAMSVAAVFMAMNMTLGFGAGLLRRSSRARRRIIDG